MKPLFDSIFVDNDSSMTLVALHGTGGSKKDFLFLDDLLDNKFNILGVQGNISENGFARFFERHEEGFFDQKSLADESKNFIEFISTWRINNRNKAETTIFIGNSNGANMILATLLNSPETIENAVLLHAMQPFDFDGSSVDFSDKKIFASIGTNDEYISAPEQQRLEETLRSTSASLTLKKYDSGHQVSQAEMKDAIKFLRSFMNSFHTSGL